MAAVAVIAAIGGVNLTGRKGAPPVGSWVRTLANGGAMIQEAATIGVRTNLSYVS
jgi:hypothetical protein